MKAHDTLPSCLQYYIRDEKLSINYVDFENIYGVLCKNNIHIKDKMHFYEQRFTIAHEIGHHEQGSLVSIDSIHTKDNKCEREADRYAMEKLLPEHELREKLELYNWTLGELEVYFGVSREVIEKRIRDLYI